MQNYGERFTNLSFCIQYQPLQERFLHMKPVFSLGKNGLTVSLKNLIGILLATVRRQAMHDCDIIFCVFQELVVYPVSRERLFRSFCSFS
jgi:hypothetical protein